jgi:hypothetical protein
MTKVKIDPYYPVKSFKVVENNGIPYSCVLNQADVLLNCNKSYVIQLVQRDREIYVLYSRFGRVGQIGSMNTDIFVDFESAKKEFQNQFKDKTGITWDDRHQDQVIDGKYRYVMMKYEDNKEEENNSVELEKDVLDLLDIIYDPTLYSSANRYNIDTEKLPLGSLSINQINKAFDIIGEISDLVEAPNNFTKIAELSSLFYTLIPSVQSKIKPIQDRETINDKISLLELLQNMYCMSKNIGKGVADKYFNLDANINHVTDPTTLNIINEYLITNRGKTHSIKLKLRSVYEVNKPREKQNFLKWNGLHNKQLLWHGTRLANAVGIISRGLCLNPTGVYTTGKMFGNGLYFANSSTKSANYMGITRGMGIMFLCEVALGNMYERSACEYITELPSGKHSTKGLGTQTPEESNIELEGTKVPIGKLVGSNVSSSLNYDEFIVYDQTQVKLKYIVLVEV